MTDLHLWLLPIIPFAGFLVNGLVGRRAPKPVVTAVALIGSLLPALWVLNIVVHFGSLTLPHVETYGTWIAAGAFHADFSFQLDQLTLVMLCVVTGVGFLIHVYSVGYMAEEEGYWRFFAYMNLFLFFMLTLVLAQNFLLMFVGWEGVGLASYLLIGFYYTRDSAANAGKKAMIVNRIGDVGFLLAMFLLVAHFGTLNFGTIFNSVAMHPDWQGAGFLTAITLFLVLGATGKSAQIPLYVWLPDAMEGPTPVSALIHAATMVTAGVYMVARTHVLFDRAPIALATVAIIGTATAFFAATIGMAQTDIKRVLAYSTVSQLGYMFLGCGVAAYSAGIFHLVTHAFFKALLFLAAGSVIHALGGEQDMRVMGGLRKKIPVTFWTMTAAVFAISGFPPLAGFVSKDEILYQAFIAPNGGKILWAVGLFTAGLTSFYMFRLWYMTFFGESRAPVEEHGAAVHARSDTKLVLEADPHSGHGHGHGIHESPQVMLWPLIILAILSVIGGWMGWPEALGGSNWFAHFVSPAVRAVHLNYEQTAVALTTGAPNLPNPAPSGGRQVEILLALLSTLVALTGWFVAHYMYYLKPGTAERLTGRMRGLYALVANKYWVDELYGAVVIAPVLFLARWILGVLIDRAVIDGGGVAAGYSAQGLGALVARIQSGNIRSYAGWLALFAALVLAGAYFGWIAQFVPR
ncbi:MAG: NADH-quinone oxidoreductase subunit L [Acidobacteriaceae bacterium]